MSEPAEVEFEGGPWDGVVLHSITARMIANVDPPFVCAYVDGRHEHYTRLDERRYIHAGPCHLLANAEEHPPCGHDHTQGW
jgi:hypothetical protein